MSHKAVVVVSLSFGTALVVSGCVPEEGVSSSFADGIGNLGDTDEGADPGDGDTSTGDGDGDGDTTTGGTSTGDGDTTTGGTSTGDGDGDGDTTTTTTTTTTTGDGDGDGDGGTTTGDDECTGESPYMGGWDIGCCQDEVVPGGWSPGQIGAGTVLPDWTFTDQYGDAVRVYDFCHEAIYFEYAAMWCGACMIHASEVANLFNTYDPQGLMTLTYMSENAQGGPTSQADVAAWAQQFGQDGIVAFSNLQNVWYPFGIDQGGGNYLINLPGTMLVEPGVEIAKLGVPSVAEIQAALP